MGHWRIGIEIMGGKGKDSRMSGDAEKLLDGRDANGDTGLPASCNFLSKAAGTLRRGHSFGD